MILQEKDLNKVDINQVFYSQAYSQVKYQVKDQVRYEVYRKTNKL